MDIQRVRNLTTGKLHTPIGDIYQDIEFLVGVDGVMTHQLGMACDAMQPWLKSRIEDERFFDGKFDQTHTGDISIKPMTAEEKEGFFVLFGQQKSPL